MEVSQVDNRLCGVTFSKYHDCLLSVIESSSAPLNNFGANTKMAAHPFESSRPFDRK